MAVIGTFAPTKEGGWVGTIRTLTIDIKVRFAPNDNKDIEAAPTFRIFSGTSEIGTAWRKQMAGEKIRYYLSVKLSDPALPEPISAAMFEADDSRTAQLIWNAKR